MNLSRRQSNPVVIVHAELTSLSSSPVNFWLIYPGPPVARVAVFWSGWARCCGDGQLTGGPCVFCSGLAPRGQVLVPPGRY